MTYIELWDATVHAASLINDAENRTRAQFRLAGSAFEQFERMFRDAVTSLSTITDPERQAETIREVRASWGHMPGIQEALNAVAKTIAEPWQREKALGRHSRLVQYYRRHYATGSLVWRSSGGNLQQEARSYRRHFPTGALAWGLVYLSTTATEVGTLSEISNVGDSQWPRLLGSEHGKLASLTPLSWQEWRAASSVGALRSCHLGPHSAIRPGCGLGQSPGPCWNVQTPAWSRPSRTGRRA